MKKLLRDENLQKKLLFIFLILQPIFDCYLLYTYKVISIFHFSPTTIIRLFFIAILGIFVLCGDTSKKNKILLFIYGVIVFVYTIMHHIVCSGIDIVSFSNFNYSIMSELLYILRMLLPIGIIYLTFKIKFEKEDFLKVINITALLISIIIIISNLFKISLASYGEGTISGNIFDWFINKGKFSSMTLASKGWFNSANQISGLLMLLLPFVAYSLFDKFSVKKSIVLGLVILSMIMLGTRTASYGWILVLFLIMAIDLFLIIIKKHQYRFESYLVVGILLVGGALCLNYAPIVSSETLDDYRINDNEADKKISDIAKIAEILKSEDLTEEEKKELLKDVNCLDEDGNLITSCLVEFLSIDSQFYERIYPVDEHKDFWNYFMFEVPIEQKYGNRNIQLLITKDVDSQQKQSLTPLFGYGNSRFISAYLYLEHDFYVHYYTIGIVGIIVFLVPYMIISLGSLLYMLIKRRFNFLNILLAIVILEVLAISYVTGHIVDELIVSIFLGFISGYLLKRMEEVKNEKKN